VTTEKRTLITLEEIIGIQLQCRKCKAKIIVPLSDKRPVPHECPNCEDPWWVNNRTDLHQQFFLAVNQLRDAAQKITDGSNNAGCIFSLEIRQPEKDEHSG
jgi:hypothetical protein